MALSWGGGKARHRVSASRASHRVFRGFQPDPESREGSGGVGRGRVGAWEGGRREEGTTDALVLALAGANRRRLALWR